jgi:hypothetical protein
MSEVKNNMPLDGYGNSMLSLPLQTPVDVTTGNVSAALVGRIIRICAVDADIRFLVGTNPTALATSHFLAQGAEIWYPIHSGDKVSVLGGTANIAVAGEVV